VQNGLCVISIAQLGKQSYNILHSLLLIFLNTRLAANSMDVHYLMK